MVLAVFDFDGTITRKDSFRHFLQFAVRKPEYYLGLALLGPALAGYFLRLVPNDVAKQKVFAHFFGGMPAGTFRELAQEYASTRIATIVRPQAIDRIEWHRNRAHTVVVVSASLRSWLGPWCRARGVELVSTEVEEENDMLTGRFRTPNCYGSEKVRRLKERFDFSAIDYVYAYGDSAGDRDILALADEKYFRCF